MNTVVSQERDSHTAPHGDSFIATLRTLAPATLAIGVGLALLVALILIHVAQGQADIQPAMVFEALVAPNDSTAHAIIRHVRLPRVTVGILAGAALAMAGVLLQTVMHNSLASPSTVGVNAGAYLALVVATMFAPAALDLSPLFIAFGGGLGAAMLVYGLAASVSATPVRLTLAGIAVAFTFAALTAALQLLYENETAGLFFWGAGSLLQTDWSGVSYAWPRLAVAVGVGVSVARNGSEIEPPLAAPINRMITTISTPSATSPPITRNACRPVGPLRPARAGGSARVGCSARDGARPRPCAMSARSSSARDERAREGSPSSSSDGSGSGAGCCAPLPSRIWRMRSSAASCSS